MKNLLSLLLILITTSLFAQDYTMYETHYLSPKPGHNADLMKEIAEHNRLYHAAGPFTNAVFSIVNGPRTGDLIFAMGPCTFSQLDGRPNSPEHNKDWQTVLAHSGPVTNAELWVRNEDLSFIPENSDYAGTQLSRVRFFEVADNALFRDVQSKIIKTSVKMGRTRPRVMYRKRFASKDGRDWATVQPYKNWAELDEDNEGPSFKETFLSLYSQEEWDKFDADFDKAIVSREDEWRVLVDPVPVSTTKK